MTTLQPRTFDPRISLAMSMHSQPGVYALLIGSGTSTGAGMLTGWGVVKNLVQRAATAANMPLEKDPTAAQIEQWWAANGDGQELGYSGLLKEAGQTPAARSALLSGYFQATAEDRENGLKIPGKAHNGIAELAARGSVKVILTTNFDELIEQALTSKNVRYQVITTEEEAAASTPLVHADCTVVKIHGDYRALAQRNTVEELSEYGPAMKELLAEVFENFGLITNGWSADWDHALVAAIKTRATRRYPLYWTTRSQLGPKAQELVALHTGQTIEGVTADDFFPDLVQRLESLDTLAIAPMTEEMAIARMKKLLPYRESYIELRDLLDIEICRIEKHLERRSGLYPVLDNGLIDVAAVDEECARIRSECQVLLRLVTIGIQLDRDRVHTDVWVWALQRLLKARKKPSGGVNQEWVALGHYPALLVLRAIAMVAVAFDREDVFIRTAVEPRWKDQHSHGDPEPAFFVLHEYQVLDSRVVNEFPRWNGTKWLFPASELLDIDLRPIILPLIGDDEDYKATFTRAEYRMALANTFLDGGRQRRRLTGGKFSSDWQWTGNNEDQLASELDFRKRGDHPAWGWKKPAEGEPDEFETRLTQLGTQLAAIPRW